MYNKNASVADTKTIVNVHVTKGTAAHCDFTMTIRDANGSYLKITGHIVGMWCAEYFAGANVRFI